VQLRDLADGTQSEVAQDTLAETLPGILDRDGGS